MFNRRTWIYQNSLNKRSPDFVANEHGCLHQTEAQTASFHLHILKHSFELIDYIGFEYLREEKKREIKSKLIK